MNKIVPRRADATWRVTSRTSNSLAREPAQRPPWCRGRRDSDVALDTSSLALELQVLIRRGVGLVLDEAEARLLHPGADAVEERQLPDGREHDAVVRDLLDLVQQRLALLA